MPSKAERPIFYYAFGGGMGHATRAAAVLRQLRRAGLANLRVLTNSILPHPLAHEGIPIHPCTGSTREALAAEISQALTAHPPALFIVDVFPAGILGELETILPALPCPKVLIARHLRPAYQRREACCFYDTIIATEDTANLPGTRVVPCPPILIRDADELLPQVDARRRLGVYDEAPLVVAISTGEAAWEEDFLALVHKVWHRLGEPGQLRVATPHARPGAISHYPLFELMPGIDVIIGAGGYNLFHESRAAGVPAIFLPQPRRYDDQHWRTQHTGLIDSPEALETALRHALTQPRKHIAFTNGAALAAAEIMRLRQAFAPSDSS